MELKNRTELKALKKEWEVFATNGTAEYKHSSYNFMRINSGQFHSLTITETDFNDLVMRTVKILKELKLRDEVLPKAVHFIISKDDFKQDGISIVEAQSNIKRMLSEANKVITILDSFLTDVDILVENAEELNSLAKEVNKFEADLPLYASDIKLALSSFRRGEFLGSILIVGRIIDVTYAKIKSLIADDEKKKFAEINAEDVDNYLIKNKVFDKNDAMLGPLKLYRNKYSHNIGIVPSPEDANIIIGATISLLKKLMARGTEIKLRL